MSEDQTPTLPPKAGRPSKAELDERDAAQDEREQELARREKMLAEAEANAVAEFEAVEGAKRQLQDATALSSLPPRQSIDESVVRQEGDNPKAMRPQMHQGKWLADTTIYEEKYHDKKLMWINDMRGDVQRWIDYGAEPVQVATRSDRVFEGITDKVESKWVRSVGGSDGAGGYFWVYLLMIDPEVYHQVKIQPERDRQELIRRAMRAGGDKSDMGDGPRLPTYDANLPTGEGAGVSVTREIVR